MLSVGNIHLILALTALVAGAGVVALEKGTGIHRLVGFAYATSMFGVGGTALVIYNLTGSFGPFHVLALVSLATLVGGLVPALLRKPVRWVERHAYFMAWSYVGLLAATVAETLTRLPEAPFWWAVVAGSAVTVAIGSTIIHRKLPATLTAFTGHRSTQALNVNDN